MFRFLWPLLDTWHALGCGVLLRALWLILSFRVCPLWTGASGIVHAYAYWALGLALCGSLCAIFYFSQMGRPLRSPTTALGKTFCTSGGRISGASLSLPSIPCSSTTWCLLLLVVSTPTLGGAAHFDRIGEADVPGPLTGMLRLTTSNPSGLRGKEAHLVELGPGVHCVSETQLSFITLPRCQATLRHHAALCSRSLRCIAGPPVACRTGSRWAGTWAGVLTVSDVPCQKLSMPWQCLENESGRLVASAHHLGNTKLQVINAYGF